MHFFLLLICANTFKKKKVGQTCRYLPTLFILLLILTKFPKHRCSIFWPSRPNIASVAPLSGLSICHTNTPHSAPY